MKLIKSSHEIWEQTPGIEGVYKAIERAGRICYRSENKITEDSAKGFVGRMVANKHLAMCEHATIYLQVPNTCVILIDNYKCNPYSKVIEHDYVSYISSNYRVLIENNWLDDLKYLCEPTEFHEKRISVHFTADIGVIREFFRHRRFSMAQESTRYCNYSKNKFNNELTFILPNWMDEKQLGSHNANEIFHQSIGAQEWSIDSTELAEIYFMQSLAAAELNYNNLIRLGWKPQQARAVLPLSLKSEAIMTGFVSDWEHLCRLRSSFAETGQPHPQASELADPLYKEFIKKGYINE